MSVKLHKYQGDCLEVLAEFFDNSAKKTPYEAFMEITRHRHGLYRPAQSMQDDIPYVCIRIPTGGGKTLMAAHAVGIAAKHYSHTESPVCLWLAPSGTIVSQTLKSLQNREHPCRMALAEAFLGRDVNCISISDALRISRADLDSGATIIVATIQSLRQEKTQGRKVYDDNENLMEHFDSIPAELLSNLRHDKNGTIHQSLDNALKLRRPIVISDEAHNSGTKLSYESLARFNPSCIIEFTATPQIENNPQQNIYASNVLAQAAAVELKNAGMIKFPIHVKTKASWREGIRASVEKQKELEEEAQDLKGEYIRPIVLYQAESKGGEATEDVVAESLHNDFQIPKNQIAVHTGNHKGLTGLDLFSPKCEIRHIVTKKALAEGWDCSFAYILCSMANLESARPVEQILGRILRMPNAKPKTIDALNRSYAFAVKGQFATVAASLRDTLVRESGFHELEAKDFIPEQSEPDGLGFPLGEQAHPDKQSETVKNISVPLLSVKRKSGLQELSFEHYLDTKWSIAKEKPNVEDFAPPKASLKGGDLNFDKKGNVVVENETVAEIREQLMLLESDLNWTEESLIAWLDKNIQHKDIPQAQSVPYIRTAVIALLEKEIYDLEKLTRYRFSLRDYLKNEINELRREKAKAGYQQMLQNMEVEHGKLQVSPKHVLTIERGKYEPRNPVPISRPLNKHLHPVIENFDSNEEEKCARHLNEMDEIKVWVRNIQKRPHSSFWLQTSRGKFYPDFICQLTDGRILVVEYKGEDRWSNDKSKESRAIGEVWAQLSDGQCLFIMPKGKNLSEIKAHLDANPKKGK